MVVRKMAHSLKEAHSTMIDNFADELGNADFNVHTTVLDRDMSSYEEFNAISSWFDLFTQLYTLVLEEMSAEEYRRLHGELSHILKQICSDAVDSPANRHAQTVSRMMIEVAFIDQSVGNVSGQKWKGRIADVMMEDESGVLEEAFEQILSYEHVDEEDLSLVIETTGEPPAETQRYQGLINVGDYTPLNMHDDFPDLLSKFYSDVRRDVIHHREQFVNEAVGSDSSTEK